MPSKVSPTSKSVSEGALATPTDLNAAKVDKVAEAVNRALADTFVLYMKTKNFHWHMTGHHFRDYHLLLDDQSETIEDTIDPLAERVRKLGRRTIHSYSEVLKLSEITESEGHNLSPAAMFDQLIADNGTLVRSLRAAHAAADAADDIATASLIEGYVDEAEKRIWFLFESTQGRTGEAG